MADSKLAASDILVKFYKVIHKDDSEWSMKCTLCTKTLKSKPGVSSNFHRHLRVSKSIDTPPCQPLMHA